ncbi:MAG: nitrous oxide reductase accessory protein NosL [Chitinophagales bacterium]|nr:nitrous oxide reductase accessory protein NosL [Chitinophagales bacterium]MBP9190538.1 nitrous oxide reductase accessory protein NosL [Chitinophagales bacterium]MBP9549257.1 nitrous oxide reductase accessory protein NosL [Chitinophagales bacterium]MBP9705479.1 nitrous oxide reductase accessory protein NosL [Chitinophagales bacterium]
MNFLKTTASLFVIVMLLQSCTKSGPVAIEYGEDPCAFCKMTIVDTKFSCELQTNKGKTYKFDDLFCLLKYKDENFSGSDNIGHIYISDFHSGEFVEYNTASFLFNPEFKSPMSGNIAAFDSDTALHEVQQEKGGELMSWDQVSNKTGI